MFDRIAPVYDLMNRVMTAGLDQRWRRLTAARSSRPGDRVLDACCGTGDLAVAGRARARRDVIGLDFSERMLERARRKAPELEWVAGRPARSCRSRTRRSTPRRSASASATSPTSTRGLRELRRVLRPGGRLGDPRDHAPRGPLAPFYRLWFDVLVPLLGQGAPGRQGLHVPPGERAPLPRAGRAGRAAGERRLRRGRATGCFGGGIVALHTGTAAVTTLDGRSARRPGLDAYLEELEARLEAAVAAHGGRVAAVGARRARRGRQAAAAAARASSASPPRSAPPRRRRRRGRARAHGDARPRRPDRRRGGAARPRGRLGGARRRRRARDRRLPLRARVRRARRRRATSPPSRCSPTRRSASRAARRCSARQRARPRHDRRGVPRALRAQDREALRGGVPARLRRRALGRVRPRSSGSPSRSPTTSSTARATRSRPGKIAGTDLREGTPTLPLLLAAREDEVVRAALAGGPLDGVLVRVAATGALERSREVALDYASEARDEPRRRDSTARSSRRSTHAVVDRSSS